MTRPSVPASRRQRLGLARFIGGLAGAALVVHVGTALALFATTVTVGGNTLSSGVWSGPAFYLHNRPTPPSGNTTSQVNLAMDASQPTASSLFRYSTDIATDKGRIIQRSALGLAETDARKYVNWRSPALTTAKTITGTITIGLWGQPYGNKGSDATVTVYVRDYNPAGGSYVEITSLTYRNPTWATGRAFVEQVFALPVNGYSLAAGHVLELRVMAPSSGAADVVLAYDMVTYQSALRLP